MSWQQVDGHPLIPLVTEWPNYNRGLPRHLLERLAHAAIPLDFVVECTEHALDGALLFGGREG